MKTLETSSLCKNEARAGDAHSPPDMAHKASLRLQLALPLETCLSLPCVLPRSQAECCKTCGAHVLWAASTVQRVKTAQGSGIADPSSASWQISRSRQECSQCCKSHVNRNRGNGGGANTGGISKKERWGGGPSWKQREVSTGWPAAVNPGHSKDHSYLAARCPRIGLLASAIVGGVSLVRSHYTL